MKWQCAMLRFVIAVLCATIVPESSGQQQAKYEHAKIDIIVLVDGSGSIGPNDYQQLINVVRHLPTIFPLGPTKARVALATFSFSTVIVQMGGIFIDRIDVFEAAVNYLGSIQERQGTATNVGLRDVKDYILPHVRPGVARALILLTDGCTNSIYNPTANGDPVAMAEAENTAKWMREQSQLRIFVVHIGTAMCPAGMAPIEQHQINMAGTPEHRFHYTEFSKLTEEVFKQVKKEIAKERCRYKEICYYPTDDMTTCNGTWFKDVANSRNNCIDHQPDTESKCTVGDCKSHCRTAWSTGDCDSLCVGMANWCLAACARCKLPEPTVHDTTVDPDDDVNTHAPPIKVPTGGKPGRGAGTNWTMWLYIGLGLGAALILIIVIAVVAVAVQRKRRKKGQEVKLSVNMEQPAAEAPHSKSKAQSKSKWTGHGAARTRAPTKTGAHPHGHHHHHPRRKK